MHDPHNEDPHLHPDEDEFAEYEEVPEQGFMERYRGLIGWGLFGLAFIVFGFYKLMDLFSSPKATEAAPTKIEKKVLVTKPAPLEKRNAIAPITLKPAKAGPTPPATTAPVALMGQPQKAIVTPTQAASASPPVAPTTTTPQPTAATKIINKLEEALPKKTSVQPAAMSPMPKSVEKPVGTAMSGALVMKPVVPQKTTTAAAKPTPAVPAPLASQPVKPAAAAAMIAPVSAAAPAKPAVAASTAVAPVAIERKLTEVEQSVAKQQKTLENQKEMSQKQLQEIRDELTIVSKDIGSIKMMLRAKAQAQKMGPITKAKRIKKPARLLVKKKEPPHHRRALREKIFIHPRVPTQTFYVEAVVPGRAWLQGSDGETISVSIGSYLEGYGRVTRIDEDRGVVATSSGHVIPYGIHAQ